MIINFYEYINEHNFYKYKYKKICFRVDNIEENKEIQKFLFDNNINWNTNRQENNLNRFRYIYVDYPIFIYITKYDDNIKLTFNHSFNIENDFSDPHCYSYADINDYKSIIKHGQLTPNYSSNRNRIVEEIEYKYNIISYLVIDQLDNVDIQDFLFKNGYAWGLERSKIHHFFGGSFPQYLYAENSTKKIYYSGNEFDEYFVDDKHYYTKEDISDFKSLIKFGIKAPNYKPKEIIRESNDDTYDLLIIKFNNNLDYIQFNNTFQYSIEFEYQKNIGKTDNNKYGIIVLSDNVKNISGKILDKYKLYATSINFVETGKLEDNFKNYNISPIFNSKDVNEYDIFLKINENIKYILQNKLNLNE